MDNYKIGDILYGSEGYDRTDVHFYKVLERTAKTLTIQEIEQKVVDGDPLRVYHVVADETKLKERLHTEKGICVYDTKPFKVHINKYDTAVIRGRCSFDTQHLYVWDGKPKWANTGYQC